MSSSCTFFVNLAVHFQYSDLIFHGVELYLFNSDIKMNPVKKSSLVFNDYLDSGLAS